MIQTVMGELLASELGVTMCHEHLALDLSPVRGDDDSRFDDKDLVCQELLNMKALGVEAVVEVSCNDMGRDVGRLKEYSKICGLHIIASTGYYLEEYHSDFVKSSSSEELCEVFCREITQGIDGTDVKAGIIGEVASGEPRMGESERRVLIGAAMAGRKTGTAVTTHCQLGRLGLEQAELLLGQGMDPAKIILGHLDLADDRAYHKELLKMGVNIGFDTIGKISYLSDERRADNLMYLVEHGYEKQLVLSQDISRRSYFSKCGAYAGYMAVMRDFVPLLKERGIKEETLSALLIHNPARILDKKEIAAK